MKTRRHPVMRFLSVFLALACSSFLTGCGGGGGSGGGNSPVGPGPTPSGVTAIEGYVSQTSISASLRADIGTALARPLTGASCNLIAFDAQGGEHVIAEAVTNERGFYRFAGVPDIYGRRNLIIRARSSGGDLEGVQPIIKIGASVRAPTLDPDSGLNATIVRRAARQGKQADLNLGEIMSLLPGKTLAGLKSQAKLDEIVDDFIARDQARHDKLGGSADTLASYAFDLQQSIQERIEQGLITPDEAWKTFDRKLAARAQELGIPADKLKALDDLDQAMIFEPAATTMQSAPGFAGDFEKIELERLRERSLRMLDTIAASMKVLVADSSSFAGFFGLVETLKKRLETITSTSEVYRLIKDAGIDMVAFTEYLSRALLQVKFTPELVSEVFKISLPEFGFGYACRLDNSSTTPVLKGNVSGANVSSSDPAVRVKVFIDQQDSFLAGLMKAIRAVAAKSAITLTDEQTKAVAWIIWARSPENLNFPAPPTPPTDPSKPDTNSSEFSLSGSVSALATQKTVAGFTFTHSLDATNVGYISAGGVVAMGAPSKPVGGTVTTTQPLAWLSAKTAFATLKVASDGSKTIATMTLTDLTAFECVEVTGYLATKTTFVPESYDGYQPMPMPVPKNDPFITSGGVVSTQSSSGSSMPGSSGSATAMPGVVMPSFSPDPLYIVVTGAVILPPSPASPQYFKGAEGRIIQPQTNGIAVSGLFLFETVDPASPCNGAVLKPAFLDFEDKRFVKLDEWVGKQVRLSGTLISGQNQTKEFLLELIESAL
ncbi:MAG: hypothetical protein HQM09_06685 [Candidatus Riflebacteria bacterium]|nr:hypothetical protein [Candidatus Riflebacteria bacterium]